MANEENGRGRKRGSKNYKKKRIEKKRGKKDGKKKETKIGSDVTMSSDENLFDCVWLCLAVLSCVFFFWGGGRKKETLALIVLIGLSYTALPVGFIPLKSYFGRGKGRKEKRD